MNENSGIDMFILERKDYGIYPETFVRMHHSIKDFLSANRLCKSVDVIQNFTEG
jgi:hypothetical protein